MGGSVGLFIALLATGHLSAAPSGGSTTPNAQDRGTAIVRGRVVAADTGAPVRRASVSIRRATGLVDTLTTDASGTFEFTELPAGRYVIAANRPPLLDSNPPVRVRLRDAQVLEGVEVRLQRGGVLVGRVVDEFGEPVVRANVAAFGVQFLNGERRIVSRGTDTTDDRGMYRVFGLPRGHYFVAAGIRDPLADAENRRNSSSTAVENSTAFAPTFFPGTAFASDARAIALEPGQEIDGLDFGLTAARLSRISGRIVDSSSRPLSDMAVLLNTARSDGLRLYSPHNTQASADGTFRLDDVAPGEYLLDVVSVASLEAIAQSGTVQGQAHTGTEFASIPLRVEGNDIDGLLVRTSRGTTVRGRVTYNGDPLPASGRGSIHIDAVLTVVGNTQQLLHAEGLVEQDGAFDIPAVALPRILRLRGLPPGWVLQSVLVNGRDVTDEPTDFARVSAGAVEVQVIEGATVSGSVEDRLGEPLDGVRVVVFPEDSGLWTVPLSRYLHQAMADANGHFKLAGLAECRYLAAVAEPSAGTDDDLMDPEVLEGLRASAVPFEATRGKVTTVTLRK